MKRSELNTIIRDAENFFKENKFYLPLWAGWSKQDWVDNYESVAEVMECQLGWDITDFGLGDYENRGLLMFTIRNGILGKDIKPYAEKIMLVGEEQVTLFHFHRLKMEDIINRGGGVLMFELYNSTPEEGLDDSDVEIFLDSVRQTVKAGEKLELMPGQSITLKPYVYHSFWAKKGTGVVMTGEVSSLNDDHTDNRFYENVGRFPEIEEDEEPYRLLVSDYAQLTT